MTEADKKKFGTFIIVVGVPVSTGTDNPFAICNSVKVALHEMQASDGGHSYEKRFKNTTLDEN